MANIGGYRGWHLVGENAGTTKTSITVTAYIHADSGYSCAWGARTMTCWIWDNQKQTASINKMNNSGNANSNKVNFTFSGLSPGTSYRIYFSYDVRATLSGSYQSEWSGYLDISTNAPTYYNVVVRIKNMNCYGSYGDPWVWINESKVEGSSVDYWGYGNSSGPDNSTYNVVHYQNGNVQSNIDTTLSATRQAYGFNLNIYDPNGTEQYQTGSAGSVEFSSDGGGSYTRLYNEPASSYYIERPFRLRNFTPGTGMKFSSISGVSGGSGTSSSPWYVSQGAGQLNINIYTAWQTYYRDINAFQPDGSNQNGLMFDYYIYNRNGQLVDAYYNVTNEVANTVTREYGYTCTINNIRPNVTGAHYTTNNITGTGAGSFSYTFNVESAACLYSAWNTYTVRYNANGGTGSAMADQGFTYNTAQNLRRNTFSRPGYDFLGWSTTNTATTATYTDEQLVNNLTSTHGDTVTLYAVWRETKPSNVQITGNVTGPFGIDLSWSCTGINVSYTLYYKKSTETDYTSIIMGSTTSKSLAVSEETTYNIYVAATNPGGTTNSNTITLTTPADQAKVRIKKDGIWKKGKTYYKKDGRWVKAKKLYIKIDGKWVINTNYDPGEKK